MLAISIRNQHTRCLRYLFMVYVISMNWFQDVLLVSTSFYKPDFHGVISMCHRKCQHRDTEWISHNHLPTWNWIYHNNLVCIKNDFMASCHKYSMSIIFEIHLYRISFWVKIGTCKISTVSAYDLNPIKCPHFSVTYSTIGSSTLTHSSWKNLTFWPFNVN